MIEAIIFDLDDTLYAYEPLDKKAGSKVEKFICEALSISKEQYKEAYRFGRNKTKEGLSEVGAGHNRLLYFQKTLEYLGVAPMPLSLQMYEQYWGTFLQEMQVFPGVKELFSFLKEKEIPIVICTDLTAHIQHRKIEALGIAPDIRYLVSSEEAGKEKPAKEMFALCLEKLQMQPENVWYVGDSFQKDIKGAASAGMKPIWFYPKEDSQEENAVLFPEGNGIIYDKVKDYAELKKRITKELERA